MIKQEENIELSMLDKEFGLQPYHHERAWSLLILEEFGCILFLSWTGSSNLFINTTNHKTELTIWSFCELSFKTRCFWNLPEVGFFIFH